MCKFLIKGLLITTLLICSSTLADAASFSTVNLSNYANAFSYGPINITLSTQGECQGYNALENNLTVTPQGVLRLFVNSSVPNVPLRFVLQDPALGEVFMPSAGIIEVTYKHTGSTWLRVYLGSKLVNVIPIQFLPQISVNVNFFHVHDIDGHSSWQMKQETMISYIQQAQSILNQVGVSIEIGEQRSIYLNSSLGDAVDAAAETLSADESLILNSVQLDLNTISVFTVWDYKIGDETKAGMHYVVPNQGAVIFLSDQTQKPGETLAHELAHALGLEHSSAGDSYLMTANEKRDMSQCLFSQTEAQTFISRA